ncbi:MAG: asparagine--tRNA ligase [Clostridiales bacterium]|jgi:asparaginyl-tRNA synthetase|nr:asparagine--tRNA ligase [Clostridiales bacterium]
MKRTLISDIWKNHEKLNGRTVSVSGWARTVRDVKNFGFIELNDGSGHRSAQVVFERGKGYDYDEIARQNVGAALTVVGALAATPENQQPFEIKADQITVEGASAEDYPLQKKRHSMEFLREKAYLRPRTNVFNAVFRIRSLAAFAIHEFFNKRGFVYVHTPIITGSDAEGAGAMFQVTTLDLENPPRNVSEKPAPDLEGLPRNVFGENAPINASEKTTGPTEARAKAAEVDYTQDFFGKKAGLTVSGQLNVEAFAMAFSNVYTFGPTFRAEKSNTTRHAAEFWMIEPEMAFCDLKGDMDTAEAMVKYIVSYTLKNAAPELEFLNKFVDTGLIGRLKNVRDNKFARLTYTEAVGILEKAIAEKKDRFEFPVFWGCDLQSEHERFITEEIYKKPVFLIDYPKDIKAFYMRLNDDGKTVAAADLLAPGIGELVGGSQREERLDMLEKRMAEMGLNAGDYWWYTDLRRFGGNKHAGYGLGFDRMVMYLTGISNIRDVTPYPRTVGSIEF